MYHFWKERQTKQETFKDVARSCGKKIREVKAQLEFNLTSPVKDNKKCFYKYINGKRRVKETLHSLLDVGGNRVTKGEEKAEVLKTFFASILNKKTGCPQDS